MSHGLTRPPASKAEDSPSANGDLGDAAYSVRSDTTGTTTDANGDYQPLKSAAGGALWVKQDGELPAGTQNIGDVDVVSVVPGTGATNLGKATDAVAGAADVGVAALFVRDDALTTITPADGDWAPSRINARGAQWIAIEDGAGGQATSFGGGTQYDEDTASAPADKLTMAGVVRLDSAASLAGSDGDRTQLQVDASGALRVTGGGGGTEYTVNAVAPADPVGTTVVMERDDQLAALGEVEGDWTNARATSKGALWVAIADSSGDPITSFGGGTQYTEDAAAAANPIGTALNLIRADSLAGLTTTDGDNVAARGTDKGELYVKHVDTVTIAGAVTNTVLSVVGSGTEATAQRVTIATDSTGVLSVDDNGGALTVDNAGTFAVQATLAAGAASIGKAEDVASADADVGVPALAVRKATPANTSGTDGDYEFLQMSVGRLWTSSTIDAALPAGANAIGKLAANSGVDIGDVDVTSIVPGTGATNLGKAIDSAVGATDTGVAALAVRDDALTTLTPADSDYVPLRENARGALWIAIEDGAGAQVTSFGGGTQYTEDVAAAADPVGTATILVRADALAAVTTTDGDNIAARGTNKGEQYVKHVDSIAVTVASGGVASGGISSGAVASGAVASGAFASGSIAAGAISVGAFAVGATSIAENEDVGSADGDRGVKILFKRLDTPANSSGTDGDYEQPPMSAGRVWGSVKVDTALPAGTNAIGKLASNAGVTIGAVEIAAAQTLSTVTTVSTVTSVTAIANALPAGANAIGKLAANSGVDIGDVDVTSLPGAATATCTNVSASASSVTLLSAAAGRKGATIWNDSSAIMYLKWGTTASATSCTVKMIADAYYELPGPTCYTGRLDAIWASATGAARITELT